MYLCILSLYVIRRGRLPGHDGRCRVGYVQWTTSPPVLRVEQSKLTSHPVRNARLKRDTGKYADGLKWTSQDLHWQNAVLGEGTWGGRVLELPNQKAVLLIP
ncbi:hypothetical protein TNCV_1020861 [Trichonephila clavipes]|uniref:Uncharacterized protein n=1 Tax=Trichonephila clavipes TaxID=2585209 RepID=A0A8X6SJ34_TRICX|nr:hypothetical protein TNCV_1020861 [Trichonephila clavipes]